ncbi:unnamed protein product [Dibothriocephalus latus]|uniref:Uncharacterized protein n=1 Tax=Dibothriocephalus latus TaxID=60516 RepID=A0A3P7LR31_DIBLA|nr:unnamed protein product [Dibothriocephalus latus]
MSCPDTHACCLVKDARHGAKAKNRNGKYARPNYTGDDESVDPTNHECYPRVLVAGLQKHSVCRSIIFSDDVLFCEAESSN